MDKMISTEQAFTQHATQNPINPLVDAEQKKPPVLLKRIGSTTYEVSIYFSNTSKETMNDKISRLIRNEAADEVVES